MSELSRGTFRASRRVLFVVALFAVLAIGRPAPVHAATTQPYLDDAVKALLYDNVTGNAWPDTFPAEWAKPNATRVARVAQFLPPLRAVGTIGLGLSAFELGWKIGRTIDERWLHLSSSMTSGRNRSADGSCTGWEIAAKQFDWSPSAAPGYFLLTFESWRPDGTPNGNSTVWPSSTNTCFGAYQAATQGLAGGPAVINGASVWVATEAEMLGKMHIVDEPYAGQPYSQAMWWSVPPMTDTVIQSIRDSIAAEGPAYANEVNAALDPTNWQRPLPTTTPVGSIPADIGGPLLVEWLAPATDETYADYLGRLRNAGWVGNAIVESLTIDEADHWVILGGVPCTSQLVGSLVPRATSTMFYVNPTVSLSGSRASDGGSCGGGFASPAAGRCKFNDAISKDVNRGSWEATMVDFGPYVLDLECEEAWQMMRDLGVIDAQGELTQSAISAAQEMQTRIANPCLREILPNHGLNIDDWRKVYLDQFNGVQFQTGAGHRFELHFYRDLADQIYIDDDFHIVFQDWFH